MMQKKYDICCVGHLTKDKIVTPSSTKYMPGGTSFYFSNAIANLDLNYLLVTAVAVPERTNVAAMESRGIEIACFDSEQTVFFENIYGENQDNRIQKVRAKADPFSPQQMEDISSTYFHLGPLLADDFTCDFIKKLSKKGIVSLDAQGFLREVRGTDVFPIDWADKREALPYVSILKANETEMEVLTGISDIAAGAKILSDWGVKEVIITLGSMGSVIYFEDNYYVIPSYMPANGAVDATGCGDTYMAGYLYQKMQGASIKEAAEFAAAMATLNIESFGPFQGTKEDIYELMERTEKYYPAIQ